MSPVIGDFVRNLIVIIFLNALLEMILPRGEFHRYIRLVTGLIVILLVVGTIAALMGRIPGLEPVIAAGPAAGAAITAEESYHERVGAAYSSQVLEQCRAALVGMIEEKIAASGRWQLEEAAVLLDEERSSGSFGAPLEIELLVKAAGGEKGRVNPVSIEPVAVGGGNKSAGEGAATPAALPELERSLAEMLGLSPAQIKVTLCE